MQNAELKKIHTEAPYTLRQYLRSNLLLFS